MKIASWNVNSLSVRLPHLQRWCADAQPDVLALQETKLEDPRFPVEAIEALGYRSVYTGQKTYNGVALLAREEPREIVTEIAGLDGAQRRLLAATVGDVRVVNLYVVNGQSVGSEKYAFKLHWLEKVTGFLAEEIKRYPRLVVVGDFNIAPDDRDVHDPLAWRDQILCSTAEREALKRVLDVGLLDSFRLFESNGGHYSWWDYRQGAFRRNLGLRIDLILVSEALKDTGRSCTIARDPRTWERPSDHAPVMMELGNG